MSWLDAMRTTFHLRPRSKMASIWEKCDSCGAILLSEKVAENLWVCDKCNYHFRITPDMYIELLLDAGSFTEMDAGVRDVDFLHWTDTKRYSARLKAAEAATGSSSALITGEGTVNSRAVVIGIMDFRFIGGSISSSVGEKFVRAAHRAVEKNLPFILITQSGGARMQESTTALMQMAKTAAAVAEVQEAGLPFTVILTNPTTGGTTASFAMLGDVHLAEPKALVGFAGPAVIREALKVDLPEGFQSSEYVLEHGFCDRIVARHEMKHELDTLLGLLMDKV